MIEAGAAIATLSAPRAGSPCAICWEGRALVEAVPSNFADRAERACSRARNAGNDLRRLVALDDLVLVGRFDTVSGVIEVDPEDEENTDVLAWWLDCGTLDEAELRTTRSLVAQMCQELIAAHGELAPAVDIRPAAARRGESGSRSSGGMRRTG